MLPSRLVSISIPLAFGAAAFPAVANAALPEPVLRMIAAAEATGDAAQVAAVHAAARAAFPEDHAELAEHQTRFDGMIEKRREEEVLARQDAIRNAGLFERWDGKGELGALRSTGNSHDTGLTASLSLERTGIEWRHKLAAQADYQRSDGSTTRERFLLSYEPNIDISGRGFVFGLAQAERDRVQGIASRTSISGGLGYRFHDTKRLKLEVKAGPAYRRTDLIDQQDDRYLAGLGALDLDWKFADRISLTQTAIAFVQDENSTFTSVTGLTAGIAGGFSTRLSYRVVHETSPADGAERTDTLSRVTLVYDF